MRPASTLIATAWTNLVVTTRMLQPAGGGTGAGTVTVRSAATGAGLIGPTSLNTSGDTTVSLTRVNAATTPGLRVEYALTSDGTATPLVQSYTVGYTSAPAPPPDTTPPTGVLLTGPSTLAKPFQVLKSMALAWTASDPESGILNYQLSYRAAPIGGGFGASTVVTTTTATGTTFAMKQGSTYCLKVRATNGKLLSTDSPERCTAQPLHAFALTAKGTWKKVSKVGYCLGRYRTAKAKGAALLKRGVRVKRLAIVATRGKGMGTVTVFLGTTKLKTIKPAATTTRKHQVIPVATFTKIRKGTLKIVVSSTGKPVLIEGLAVSKL